MEQIFLAFLTGISTGGVSCVATQGALLASIAGKVSDKYTTVKFLASKIVAYTIVGFLLGLLGQKLQISPNVQGFFLIFAGVVTLIAAGQIADIHPIFKRFAIQPPAWLFRSMRAHGKNGSIAPFVLGAFTVLIPCGVTQAMMILSAGTANPVLSALIMFAFTLGTSPYFFTIGFLSEKVLSKKKLATVAALVIAVFGVISINNGQRVRGSFHTIENYWKAATSSEVKSASVTLPKIGVDGKQEVEIEVDNSGYTANFQALKVGVPTRLTLKTNNTVSCARAFVIPQHKITKILPETGETTIEFTPTKTGNLAFTCTMGMYTGAFTVVN